jgi:hypothetical protein
MSTIEAITARQASNATSPLTSSLASLPTSSYTSAIPVTSHTTPGSSPDLNCESSPSTGRSNKTNVYARLALSNSTSSTKACRLEQSLWSLSLTSNTTSRQTSASHPCARTHALAIRLMCERWGPLIALPSACMQRLHQFPSANGFINFLYFSTPCCFLRLCPRRRHYLTVSHDQRWSQAGL